MVSSCYVFEGRESIDIMVTCIAYSIVEIGMMLSSGLDENSITQHLALKTSFTASVETRDHPSCSDLSRVKYGDCIENLGEMLKSVDLPTDASLVSTEYRIRTFLEKSTKVAYLYYTRCIYKLSGGLTSYIFLCLYIIRSI